MAYGSSVNWLVSVLAVVAGLSVPAVSAASSAVMVVTLDARVDREAVEQVVRDAGFEPARLGDGETALRAMAESRRAAQERIVAEVEVGLARIKDAYLEQRWDDILEEVGALEKKALSLDDPATVLWDVVVQRAIALRARGRAQDGPGIVAAMALAHALDGKRRLPKGLYGPDVDRDFADAMAASTSKARRTVVLAPEPSDAVIVVDGKRVSGSEAHLAPGTHLVVMHAPGYTSLARLLEVPPLEIAGTLQATTGPALERLGPSFARGDLASATRSGARLLLDLASARGAATVVVVGQGGAWLVDSRGSTRSASGLPAEAVRRVLSELGTGGLFGARHSQDTPLVKKWWFWTGVVALAAAGIAGGYYLTRDDGNGTIEIGVVP